MAEDEVRALIRSVARRGTALGVSTLPEEIRHNLSHSRHAGGHRIVTASVLRRRITPVLVAAVVLAVFFVPVPHVSLFNRLVAPAKSSTMPRSNSADRWARDAPRRDIRLFARRRADRSRSRRAVVSGQPAQPTVRPGRDGTVGARRGNWLRLDPGVGRAASTGSRFQACRATERRIPRLCRLHGDVRLPDRRRGTPEAHRP